MTPETITEMLYAIAKDLPPEEATAQMLALLIGWGNLRECEGKMKAGEELLESFAAKGL